MISLSEMKIKTQEDSEWQAYYADWMRRGILAESEEVKADDLGVPKAKDTKLAELLQGDPSDDELRAAGMKVSYPNHCGSCKKIFYTHEALPVVHMISICDPCRAVHAMTTLAQAIRAAKAFAPQPDRKRPCLNCGGNLLTVDDEDSCQCGTKAKWK